MNKERLLNTFLDLVKIYSPSKNEINVMKYITEKLEKLFALDLFILFEYIDNSKKLLILWL